MLVQVPKGSWHSSPHCNSIVMAGGGGLWSSEGDGGGEHKEHGSIAFRWWPGFSSTYETLSRAKLKSNIETHPNVTHAHCDQESSMIRHSTPALPCVPLLQPGHCNGAKSGLPIYRWQVVTVAHMGQQDWPTEILTWPSNASAGAKRLLMQVTPLWLHSNSRRGWPHGPQSATVEEVKSSAQPAFTWRPCLGGG